MSYKKIKKIITNTLIIIIVFLGTMSSLAEFSDNLKMNNHIFIGILITFLIIFIWKNIIQKLLEKWL